MSTMRFVGILGIILLGDFVFSAHAHAYIDPASGSFLLQILLATLFGALFFGKQVTAQIRTLFLRLFGRHNGQEKQADDDSSEGTQP
jgi:hypothetical protein